MQKTESQRQVNIIKIIICLVNWGVGRVNCITIQAQPHDFSIVQRLQVPTGKKGLKIQNSTKPKDLTLRRRAVITSALGLIAKMVKAKFLSMQKEIQEQTITQP